MQDEILKRSQTNDLLTEIVSFSNLHLAFNNAKRNKKNKKKIMEFELGLGSNLKNIRRDILNENYTTSHYTEFEIFEPKKRTIHAPSFRDNVVQWAIYQVVNPIIDKSFIYHLHSCRIGKGTLTCRDYVFDCVRKSKSNNHIIHFDISKYFYSLSHEKIIEQLQRKLNNKEVVNLIGKFLPYNEEGIGVPIGNLLSQMLANLYLSEVDHFVKRELKIKFYCRYMDDFILIDIPEYKLQDTIDKITERVSDLKLKFSKIKTPKVSDGVTYVGSSIHKKGIRLKPETMRNFKRTVRQKDWNKCCTYIGLAKRTRSLIHMYDILDKVEE